MREVAETALVVYALVALVLGWAQATALRVQGLKVPWRSLVVLSLTWPLVFLAPKRWFVRREQHIRTALKLNGGGEQR